MRRGDGGIDLDGLTAIHWFAIALALVSAGVHLVLGLEFLPHYMGIAFLLATGGFVGAVVLVLVDYRRRLVYALGIPFVGVQLVFWYLANEPDGLRDVSAPEAIDKVAQLLLLVLLVVMIRRDS